MQDEVYIKRDKKLNVPFSPPYIDEDVIAEVVATLRSGWITTGPKVKELEFLGTEFSGCDHVVCVNSWTSGAMLVLKWLGVGAGDEVIIPAYTYAATALAVLHMGAKPVMVDIGNDFTIDPKKVQQAITPSTKAILTVDIGGMPCDYDAIRAIVNSDETVQKFNPSGTVQQQLGRPLVIADAAHSIGATYNKKPAALAADITIYSFHAVKNITTAEGGMIALNLPGTFSNKEVYDWMKLNSLNGQTKDAFTKNKDGSWRYDIVSDGFKINMPDVCAAIGVGQLKKYASHLLPERMRVYNAYERYFRDKDWAIIPPVADDKRHSCYHLFMLRIRGISEQQRNLFISKMAEAGVSVNVHFIPLPMLSLFKGLGYAIEHYPVSYANYSNEISLPIYPQLTDEQCNSIAELINEIYNEIKE